MRKLLVAFLTSMAVLSLGAVPALADTGTARVYNRVDYWYTNEPEFSKTDNSAQQYLEPDMIGEKTVHHTDSKYNDVHYSTLKVDELKNQTVGSTLMLKQQYDGKTKGKVTNKTYNQNHFLSNGKTIKVKMEPNISIDNVITRKYYTLSVTPVGKSMWPNMQTTGTQTFRLKHEYEFYLPCARRIGYVQGSGDNPSDPKAPFWVTTQGVQNSGVEVWLPTAH